MSIKKQKPILSDKIAELIAPRRLLDPEIDSEDETAARIDYEIDEDLEKNEAVSKFSDIRKKNVKFLQDLDAKYRGKVSSRKELEMESNESDENDENDEFAIEEEEGEEVVDSVEKEQEEEEESTEKSIGEFSMTLTPKQRIKLAQEGADSAEKDENDSVNSPDDDVNLKAFRKKLNQSNLADINTESDGDSDDNMFSNEKAELDKWDDDYEGEEIEEESEKESAEGSDNGNDNDEEDEFDSDEDESDFDGGDMIPGESKEISDKEDLSRILPKQSADDSLSKAVCVQNQLQIWEKLLEVRIHTQKMLIKANSMPQTTKFKELSRNEEFSELAIDTVDQVSKLVSQMRNLQSLLLNRYTETKQIALKRKPINLDNIKDPEMKRTRLAEELEKDFLNFKDYQYSVISKWHDRTKVLTPGSIKTQKQQGNIDVLRKIEGVLANREELIKKTQLLKGGYELFGKSTEIVEKNQLRAEAEADTRAENGAEKGINESEHKYSTEIYDDTDFYHTQLRELIEYKTSSSNNANEMAKQFTELQKLRKKMKKTVDTRASKGRKIRFVVHNKLVSFMAPNDSATWSQEQKDELFKSLFGAQS